MRAHWRVLEEASASATVVPVRFGMVMEDDDAVRTRLLEANEPALTALLHELAGKVQLTVKGEYDEEAMLREVVRTTPAVAELNARISSVPADAAYYDRIRLGELVAEEVERRRLADTDEALRRLTPAAVEVREQEVRTATAAFDLAFLVARDGVDAFSEAVRALDEAVGDRIALQLRRPAAALQLRRGQSGPREPGMGLIMGLLTLPLAPVRGTVWIAERLEEQAEPSSTTSRRCARSSSSSRSCARPARSTRRRSRRPRTSWSSG